MQGCLPMLIFGFLGLIVLGPIGLIAGILIGGFLGEGLQAGRNE